MELQTIRDKFAAIDTCEMRFTADSIATESNGDGTKTYKIRIKARDSKPISHPYWGRIVHDFAGMQWHKSKIAIDYCHNDAQILGYVNHFDIQEDGLYLSGVLTPFTADDKTSQVIHLLTEGVPLEASIDFCDDMNLAFLPPNTSALINGQMVDGAEDGVVVVTSWYLRRIAICPSGADANTETSKQWSKTDKAITPTIQIFGQAQEATDAVEALVTSEAVAVGMAVSLAEEGQEAEAVTEANTSQLTAEDSSQVQAVEAQAVEAEAKATAEAEGTAEALTAVEAVTVEANAVGEAVEAEATCQDCQTKEATIAQLSGEVARLTQAIGEANQRLEAEKEAQAVLKAQGDERANEFATERKTFALESARLSKALEMALNGNSSPIQMDGRGEDAEPKTWGEAVTRLGYVGAREKYLHLRK